MGADETLSCTVTMVSSAFALPSVPEHASKEQLFKSAAALAMCAWDLSLRLRAHARHLGRARRGAAGTTWLMLEECSGIAMLACKVSADDGNGRSRSLRWGLLGGRKRQVRTP